MKVLCISGLRCRAVYDTVWGNIPVEQKHHIFTGEVYTVVDEEVMSDGNLYYTLAEKDHGSKYDSRYFTPFTELEEDRLAEAMRVPVIEPVKQLPAINDL